MALVFIDTVKENIDIFVRIHVVLDLEVFIPVDIVKYYPELGPVDILVLQVPLDRQVLPTSANAFPFFVVEVSLVALVADLGIEAHMTIGNFTVSPKNDATQVHCPYDFITFLVN